MNLLRRIFAAMVALPLIAMATPTLAQGVGKAEWAAYKAKFLDPSGRIVDDANGNISHSEGQGYGMLLAFMAGDRGDFDRIWAFTRSELMLRDDGMAAWRWDPNANPHITDVNNASDGDLLIAYALALAGKAWSRPDLTKAGGSLATAIGESAIDMVGGRPVLLPGVHGFGASDREDGPVVNVSYWVFEAFPTLSGLAPQFDWNAVSKSGLALVASVASGVTPLPPDWLSLRKKPRAAIGFPPEFGYNAIRIPLYLVRAGVTDRALLAPLRDAMSAPDGSVRIVNTANGDTNQTISDSGYRAIPAIVSCVIDGTKLPADVRVFVPTSYYPSTLHLLVLSFASRRHPECL